MRANHPYSKFSRLYASGVRLYRHVPITPFVVSPEFTCIHIYSLPKMKLFRTRRGCVGGNACAVANSYYKQPFASNRCKMPKAQNYPKPSHDINTLLGSLMAKWLLKSTALDILLKNTTFHQSAIGKLRRICATFTSRILKAPLRNHTLSPIRSESNFKFEIANAIQRRYQGHFLYDPKCVTKAFVYLKCRYD